MMEPQSVAQLKLTIITHLQKRNIPDDKLMKKLLKKKKYDVVCLHSTSISADYGISVYERFQTDSNVYVFLIKKCDQLINATFKVVSNNIIMVSFNFRQEPEKRYDIFGVFIPDDNIVSPDVHQSLVEILSQDCKTNIKIFLGNFGSEKNFDSNLIDLIKKFNLRSEKVKTLVKLLLKDDFNCGVTVTAGKQLDKIILLPPGFKPFQLDPSLITTHKNKILLFVTWDILDNNYLDKKDAIELALTERQVDICCLQSDKLIVMDDTRKYYDCYHSQNSYVSFMIRKGTKISDLSYKKINPKLAVISFNLRAKSYAIMGVKLRKDQDRCNKLRGLAFNIKKVSSLVEFFVCGNFYECTDECERFVERMKLKHVKCVRKKNKFYRQFWARQMEIIIGFKTSLDCYICNKMIMIWFGYQSAMVLQPQTHMFNISTWCISKDLVDIKDNIDTQLTECGKQHDIVCIQNTDYINRVEMDTSNFEWYHAHDSIVTFLINKYSQIVNISFKSLSRNIAVLDCKFSWAQWQLRIINVFMPKDSASGLFWKVGEEIRRTPAEYFLFVVGNFNASCGKDLFKSDHRTSTIEHIKSNLNGKLLSGMLKKRNLLFVSSLKTTDLSYNTMCGDVSHLIIDKYSHVTVHNVTGITFSEVEDVHKLITMTGKCNNDFARKSITNGAGIVCPTTVRHKNMDHKEVVINKAFQNVNTRRNLAVGFTLATWTISVADWKTQSKFVDSALFARGVAVCSIQTDIDTIHITSTNRYRCYGIDSCNMFFMVRNTLSAKQTTMECLSRSITVLKFKLNLFSYSLLTVVIPSEEDITSVFCDLQCYMAAVDSDCTIVVGNFCAAVGLDDIDLGSRCFGRTYVSHSSDKIGIKLIKLTQATNYYLLTTFFNEDILELMTDNEGLKLHLLTNTRNIIKFSYISSSIVRDVDAAQRLITMHAEEIRNPTSSTIHCESNDQVLLKLATWNMSKASYTLGTTKQEMETISNALNLEKIDIALLQRSTMHSLKNSNEYRAILSSLHYINLCECNAVLIHKKSAFFLVTSTYSRYTFSLIVQDMHFNKMIKLIGVYVHEGKKINSNEALIELEQQLENNSLPVIILGDFSAHVGEDVKTKLPSSSSCVGNALRNISTNDLGVKLVQLAIKHKLIIWDTFINPDVEDTVGCHILSPLQSNIKIEHCGLLNVPPTHCKKMLTCLVSLTNDITTGTSLKNEELHSPIPTLVKSQIEDSPIRTTSKAMDQLRTDISCITEDSRDLKRKTSPSRPQLTPPVKRVRSNSESDESDTPLAPLISTVLQRLVSDWRDQRKDINAGGWKIASWFIPEFTGITNEIEDTLMKNNIDIACVQVNNKRYSRDNSKNYFQICGQRKYNTFPSILFLINRQTGFNLIDYIMCSSNISVLQFNHTSSKEIKVIIGMNSAKNTSSMKQLELNLIKYVKKPKIPTTVIVTGKLNDDVSSSSSTSHHNLTGKLFSKFINKYKLTLHPCSIETRHIASCNVGLNCCQVNVTNLLSMIVATVVNSNEDVTATSALQTSAVTQFNQGEVARGIMKNLLTKPLPQPEPQPAFNKNGAARTMKMEVSSNEEDERVEMGEDLPSAEDSGAVSLTDNNVTLVVSELKTEETQPHQTTAITSSKPNPNCAIEQLLKAAERLNNSRCGETVEAKVVAVTKPALVLANYDLRRCYKLDMLTKILQDNNVDIACVYLTPPQTHRLGNSLNNYQLHSTSYTHVQFLVNNNLKIKTLQTKEISPSISSLTFTSDLLAYRINIFGVICLTYTQYLKHVDVFHELSNVLNSVGDDTHCILMGLFNCKIGTELIQDEQQIIGPNVHYKTSTGNIGRLMLLCRQFNLRVQTTFDSIVRDELEELFNYTQHVLVDNNSPFNIKVESVYNKQFITGLLMLKTFVYFV